MPLLKSNKNDNHLTLTLCDPKTRNAFSPAMAEEFYSLLQSESYDSLTVLAEGPLFCSGGNLSFYAKLESPAEGLECNQRISEILKDLYELPVPTSCYVQGPVFGGGVELLSCFDFVASHPSSLFGLWQRRIGLTFGWGGQPRLIERMRASETEKWLFSADTYPAWKVLHLGLVDELAFYKSGPQLCRAYCDRILSFGLDNFKVLKKNRRRQVDAFQKVWMQDSHIQALNKFKKKKT